MDSSRIGRALPTLGVIALSVALLYVGLLILGRLKAVVLILLGAVFLAYLLYPMIRFLQNRRFPRWLAILTVYAVLGLVVAAAVSYGGPPIAAQARTFSTALPSIVHQIHDGLVHANNNLLGSVPIETRQNAADYVNRVVADLQVAAGAYTGKALTILLNVVTVVSGLVIVPILSFYILLDSERLAEGFIGLFPARVRTQVTLILKDVDQVLGGFIRGQIIVAAFVAVAVTIALLVLRIPYAFLIGVFAGVVDMIPYVGAIAGAIPAVIIAFFTHGIGWALLVVLAFLIVYELEGHIVAPSIVGKRVGLTALLVIVAILVGAEFGGILGMFVAVPVAAIARVLWKRFAYPVENAPPTTALSAESMEPKTIVVVNQ